MSRLKLYRGDAPPVVPTACEDRAAGVLSYESHFQRRRQFPDDTLQRARTLRTNDRCPHCARARVEPLELADALRNRNNRPIPGTATLVGFHCRHCHWEWPA